MIYVGIDVAKDKHDCSIINSDGKPLFKVFQIQNTREGFDKLFSRISSAEPDASNVKVGLEATGHYHLNLLGYLLDKSLPTCVLNPLQVSAFKKGVSLRKTKTDTVDARVIAKMLMSDMALRPYSDLLYQLDELKSISRYRFRKIQEQTKLKVSISRLVSILFPELEQCVSSLHLASVYALLSELPSAKDIASCNILRLTSILGKASHMRFKKAKAEEIKAAAKASIGRASPSLTLELKQTIKMAGVLNAEIKEINAEIEKIMRDIDSPILSIPGIGFINGAMILAEIGDFSRFSSPDKILAFAGISPSSHQSGKSISGHARMEKRGSRYLRFALINATRLACQHEPFRSYLLKKQAEGKHYNVAIPHAAKKLVRIIFALTRTNQPYKWSRDDLPSSAPAADICRFNP